MPMPDHIPRDGADGSGQRASQIAIALEGDHTYEQRRLHTVNRSDRTDRCSGEEEGTPEAGTPEGMRSQSLTRCARSDIRYHTPTEPPDVFLKSVKLDPINIEAFFSFEEEDEGNLHRSSGEKSVERQPLTRPCLSEKSLDAVATNGIVLAAGYSKSNSDWPTLIFTQEVMTPQQPSLHTPSVKKNAAEFRACPKSLYLLQDRYRSSLTESLWRPFARRRESTERPLFVAMRCRNP